MADDLEKRRRVAEAAARAAGAVHLRYYQTGIDYKGKHGDRRDARPRPISKGSRRPARDPRGLPDATIIGEEDDLPRERRAEILAGASDIDPLPRRLRGNFPSFAPAAYVEALFAWASST